MPDRLVMGLETEYGLTGTDARGYPVATEALARALLQQAGAIQPTLPDGGSGRFLPNGGRLYVDCGSHPEYATPECADPWSLVVQLRAGELQLHRMVERLTRHGGGFSRVTLLRANLDYSEGGTTWGCHESYLHRCPASALPEQLLPHLASRVIYTGAGGFHPFSPGLEFTLSPRVWLLGSIVASDSTRERPLFHTRDEPLAGFGYSRLHVIAGESLCSDEAVLLKTGITALIVASIDAGCRPIGSLRLENPLQAARSFTADPQCRATARLGNGGKITALQLQYRYLRSVEACGLDGKLPAWADVICGRWRRVLQQLSRNPAEASRSLDWAIKRAAFGRWLPPGMTWDRLRVWNEIASLVAAVLAERRAIDEPARALPRSLATMQAVRRTLQDAGLQWEGYRQFRKLRAQLLEADLRFGQLDQDGIFAQLDAAGVLRHRTALPAAIEQATRCPPGGTRAKVRGEWVRQLGTHMPDNWQCGWAGIRELRGLRQLDLDNPFSVVPIWRGPGGAPSFTG
jgi:proteasome accessory factor A